MPLPLPLDTHSLLRLLLLLSCIPPPSGFLYYHQPLPFIPSIPFYSPVPFRSPVLFSLSYLPIYSVLFNVLFSNFGIHVFLLMENTSLVGRWIHFRFRLLGGRCAMGTLFCRCATEHACIAAAAPSKAERASRGLLAAATTLPTTQYCNPLLLLDSFPTTTSASITTSSIASIVHSVHHPYKSS